MSELEDDRTSTAGNGVRGADKADVVIHPAEFEDAVALHEPDLVARVNLVVDLAINRGEIVDNRAVDEGGRIGHDGARGSGSHPNAEAEQGRG